MNFLHTHKQITSFIQHCPAFADNFGVQFMYNLFQDETEISDVEEMFGFSKVIKTISESKKLVVGRHFTLK